MARCTLAGEMTTAIGMERAGAAGAGQGTTGAAVLRLRLTIGGAVQGVGFRPYVYRLAVGLGLRGWVRNSAVGVTIEVEGEEELLRSMRDRIESERPAGCHLASVEGVWLDALGYEGFAILESHAGETGQIWVRPDVATCAACVDEIFDPTNRRHGYAFTNCTHCGPRYSIIESVPYDRERTSMKRFEMCPTCRAEYNDPGDRRFHAQPNACPVCGPQLALWNAAGGVIGTMDHALTAAVELLRSGGVLALKGLGGFQLLVDAGSEEAVRRLRQRKEREEKPLAVVFPGLEAVGQACVVTTIESALLRSPEAPIVLLRRRADPAIELAESVAPGNPWLGVMLPYTPLHHLLLRALDRPVVATSGNLSDEPICIDEFEALARLRGIADGFLVHDRPIVRQVDDSIVRAVAGREMVLRRARGYAPLPVRVKVTSEGALEPGPVLAVGGQLKNTVAVGVGTEVFLSQHIGDLENALALAVFGRVCGDLPRLLQLTPRLVMADSHPGYLSTKAALRMGLPCHTVQHHYAHVLACMAENELDGPVLGIAWDGTGWGIDGTIWGGESLVTFNRGYRRFAALRQFPLPGSDRAVREPRRSALGVLWELDGPAAFERGDLPPVMAFEKAEREILRTALDRGLNCPRTSSMGRLFDAVAGLSGLRQRMTFEGQAAMELEWAMEPRDTGAAYELAVVRSDCEPRHPAQDQTSAAPPEWWIDWEPMIRRVIEDVQSGVAVGLISARFHRGLSRLVLGLAERAGLERVVLTGGCFQNRVLLEECVGCLRAAGYRVYWPQRVPANDGGLAVGQVVAGMLGHGDRREGWATGGLGKVDDGASGANEDNLYRYKE
jgi:hydrogenase maturation protein HypF